MGGHEEGREVEVPPSPARPARLHPFHALRLAPDHVADLGGLRPMGRPYREAARRLEDWEARGRLDRDAEPALHLHEYSSQGITVRGVVGALDLSTRAERADDRAILPHEAVHPEQVEDLAGRMDELGLNPAPILLVHRGTPESRAVLDDVARHEPDHAFTDRTGQQHREWRITRPEHLAALATAVARQPLLIADGHHRYAAYLRIQRLRAGTDWDRGLAMVVDQDDTPLFLGAIHRVLHDVALGELARAARESGARVVDADRERGLAALAPGAWVATDGDMWIVVEPGGHLAVEHLHLQVLPRLGKAPGTTVHRHSVDEALDDAGHGNLAVLLPAPEFDQVEQASRRGRLLPEKATSFQPKPSLGVYMRAVPEEK